MEALMEVFSLSHEHSTDDVDYTREVKELLTESDIDQFSELCDDGMLVDSDECDLYEEYYRHVSEGRTQFAQVSYGMTTNEQDDEDEATGWGGSSYHSSPALLLSFSPDVCVHLLSRTSFAAGECVFQRVHGEFFVLLMLVFSGPRSKPSITALLWAARLCECRAWAAKSVHFT